MNKECCGTCSWHFVMLLDRWLCGNKGSDNYGLGTEYGDCCVDYEERE